MQRIGDFGEKVTPTFSREELESRKAKLRRHMAEKNRSLRLLLTSPERAGSGDLFFFEEHRGNILRIDQYRQPGCEDRFFLRMEFT